MYKKINSKNNTQLNRKEKLIKMKRFQKTDIKTKFFYN